MEGETERKARAFGILQAAAYHAADRAWSGLLSFLTAQSVLVLAWAAILVVREIPSRGIVMVAISVVGVLTSLVWAPLGTRMWDYHLGYVSKLRTMAGVRSFLPEWSGVHRVIEREWRRAPDEDVPASRRAFLWIQHYAWLPTANHWVMFVAPVLFSGLHMSMLYVGWCCDIGPESAALSHQQCSCEAGGFWLVFAVYVAALALALVRCWKSLKPEGLFSVSDVDT